VKAVRLHEALDLRVEEVDAPPPPAPGFANLAVRAAGICGSDLHNFRTGQWISRKPSTAGHELCGRVSAVGDGVADMAVGDLVVADSRYWCGECAACRSGLANVCERLGFVGEVCDGGFAEQVQLPARLLVKHDPGLPAGIAAMAEPLAVALHAVHRLAPRPGEPVMVVGCGTIGGLAALVLSRLHDGPLLVSDVNRKRAATVADLAGGVPVALEGEAIATALGGRRLRYALDATGSIAAIDATLGLMAGGGALALVGIGHGRLELDPTLLVEREISLIGCHAFADELPEATALLTDLAPALARICERLPSLDEVPNAYRRLIEGPGEALKTIVEIAP
jgi:(R,R)-butanediol dehydrogenase/meso-butanediol dehydrogenase/diacetyl reductase